MKSRLDVDLPALDGESKVVVKLVAIAPHRPGFSHFIDYAAGRDEFEHESFDFLECNAVQLLPNPLVRLFA